MEERSSSILIVNTLNPEDENIISCSERSLINLIGPEIKTRVISVFNDLNQEVPEKGVILNGSMFSVVDRPFWLDKYKEFIKRMVDEDKFILGICFGSQLLGDIYGSNVEKSNKVCLGHRKLQLNNEALEHPMFHELPQEIRVPSFHFDHIKYKSSQKLPLGFSSQSHLYAFEVCFENRRSAWGLQFHPEMTRERLLELLDQNKEYFLDFKSIREEILRSRHPEYGPQIIRNYVRELLRRNQN